MDAQVIGGLTGFCAWWVAMIFVCQKHKDFIEGAGVPMRILINAVVLIILALFTIIGAITGQIIQGA